MRKDQHLMQKISLMVAFFVVFNASLAHAEWVIFDNEIEEIRADEIIFDVEDESVDSVVSLQFGGGINKGRFSFDKDAETFSIGNNLHLTSVVDFLDVDRVIGLKLGSMYFDDGRTMGDIVDTIGDTISDLGDRVDDNTNDISENAAEIADNTSAISDNADAIANIDTDFTNQINSILENTANILENHNNIAINADDIDRILNIIKGLKKNVKHNKKDIAELFDIAASTSEAISNHDQAILQISSTLANQSVEIEDLEKLISKAYEQIFDLEDLVHDNERDIESKFKNFSLLLEGEIDSLLKLVVKAQSTADEALEVADAAYKKSHKAKMELILNKSDIGNNAKKIKNSVNDDLIAEADRLVQHRKLSEHNEEIMLNLSEIVTNRAKISNVNKDVDELWDFIQVNIMEVLDEMQNN
jgi:chromosome segregation ATPase